MMTIQRQEIKSNLIITKKKKDNKINSFILSPFFLYTFAVLR